MVGTSLIIKISDPPWGLVRRLVRKFGHVYKINNLPRLVRTGRSWLKEVIHVKEKIGPIWLPFVCVSFGRNTDIIYHLISHLFGLFLSWRIWQMAMRVRQLKLFFKGSLNGYELWLAIKTSISYALNHHFFRLRKNELL